MKHFPFMLGALLLLGSLATTASAEHQHYPPSRYIPGNIEADDLEDYYEELQDQREDYLETLEERYEEYYDNFPETLWRGHYFDTLSSRGIDRRYSAYPFRNRHYPLLTQPQRGYRRSGFGLSLPGFSLWIGR